MCGVVITDFLAVLSSIYIIPGKIFKILYCMSDEEGVTIWSPEHGKVIPCLRSPLGHF